MQRNMDTIQFESLEEVSEMLEVVRKYVEQNPHEVVRG